MVVRFHHPQPKTQQLLCCCVFYIIVRGVAQLVARLVRVQKAVGSSPVTPTISSVHNGFELWTLDFFVISSFFVMYGAGFMPALLFYADLVIYSTDTPFRVSAL